MRADSQFRGADISLSTSNKTTDPVTRQSTRRPRRVDFFMTLRHERRDLDLDLGAVVDEAADIEQRRRREIAPERLLPGGADAAPAASYSLRLVRYQVRRTMCSGPAPASARSLMIRFSAVATWARHVRRVIAGLVAAGLPGQHDPAARPLRHHAMRKAARFLPFGRLQDTHRDLPIFLLICAALARSPWHRRTRRFGRCKRRRCRRYRPSLGISRSPPIEHDTVQNHGRLLDGRLAVADAGHGGGRARDHARAECLPDHGGALAGRLRAALADHLPRRRLQGGEDAAPAAAHRDAIWSIMSPSSAGSSR